MQRCFCWVGGSHTYNGLVASCLDVDIMTRGRDLYLLNGIEIFAMDLV